MTTKHFKKIISAILIVFMVGLGLYVLPNKVSAQFGGELSVPSHDTGLNPKESGISVFGVSIGLSLDGLMWEAANFVIARMTDAIVQWIRNGFSGGPAFATDPGSWFTETADRVGGIFLQNLTVNGQPLSNLICAPLRPITLALDFTFNRHTFERQITCTLSQALRNLSNFASFTSGNFTGQGGWNSWFNITQNEANNPYGVYWSSKIELDERIASALGIEQQQLSWGGGFLSWRRCVVSDPSFPRGCKEYGPVETPGSVIESQLNESLSAGQHRLEVADEINEILSALLEQLVSQVLHQGLIPPTPPPPPPPPGPPEFAVVCSATRQELYLEPPFTGWTQPVKYKSQIYGGSGLPVTYLWTLTPTTAPNIPYNPITHAPAPTTYTTASVPFVVYHSAGIKKAKVRATIAGQPETDICQIVVTSAPPLTAECVSPPDPLQSIGHPEYTWIVNMEGGTGRGSCVFTGGVSGAYVGNTAPREIVGTDTSSHCSIFTAVFSQLPGVSYVTVDINTTDGQHRTIQCPPSHVQ